MFVLYFAESRTYTYRRRVGSTTPFDCHLCRRWGFGAGVLIFCGSLTAFAKKTSGFEKLIMCFLPSSNAQLNYYVFLKLCDRVQMLSKVFV